MIVGQGAMLAMVAFHLLLWLQLWLAAPALPDFHNTYVAGTIWLHQHSVAYDLGLAETAQAKSAHDLHSPYHFNPFVQIPAWLWVAGLLARLPYRAAYLMLTLANLAMVAISAWFLIGAGVSRAHRVSLYLLVAAALPTWIDLFQAQTMPLVLLATATGYKLSASRPRLGGLILSLAGFRYHVSAPVVLALAWGRRRLLVGLLLGVVGVGLASLIAVDGNLAAWIATTKYVSTIYLPVGYSLRYFVQFTPKELHSSLNIAIIPLGVALGVWLFWRLPRSSCSSLLAVAIAWSLVTPYSYLGDLSLIVLLTVGYLAELIRQARLSVVAIVATCALLAGLELTPTFSFLSLFPAELLLLIAIAGDIRDPIMRGQATAKNAAGAASA